MTALRLYISVFLLLSLSYVAKGQSYAEYFNAQLLTTAGKAPMLPSDTLDLGEGQYLFLQISPLAVFAGYDTPPLQEEVITIPYGGSRERSYSCRWGLTKEGQLYLQDINYRPGLAHRATAEDKAKLLRWAKQLTGQTKLPLSAEWLSGSFRAYRSQQSNHPYREEAKNREHRSQKAHSTGRYLLYLERGQLRGIRAEQEDSLQELSLGAVKQGLR